MSKPSSSASVNTFSKADLHKVVSLPPGPVALVLNEDDAELAATISHHARIGFDNIVVLGPERGPPPAPAISLRAKPELGLAAVVNPLLEALVGRWVLVVWNAEFFFFPFCEDRGARDAIAFAQSEGRHALHAVTVDLYGEQAGSVRQVVNREACFFDGVGYFAEDRFDGPEPVARQINVFGGLKWRYAQHVPWPRQHINRVPLFQVSQTTRLDEQGHLSDPEQNTYQSAWHHSLTGAVASFRVAKSLLHNPGSQVEIDTLMWSASTRFNWTSTQLMEAGFMEPGQWF